MTLSSSVITLSSTRTAAPSPQGFHVLRQDFNPRRPADIRANDGNLSIPLYVRGKAVGDEKGKYAANGLKEAVNAWQESSDGIRHSVELLVSVLGKL